MKSKNSSNPTIIALIIISLISVSTFMMFMFIFEFSNNYKIIKLQNQFKKIKVKIDSSEVSYTRSAKSSSSTTTYYYYFNNECTMGIQDAKGILFSHKNLNPDINEYMSNHMDSLNVWYLNKNTVKYAYENQKKIDVSEEVENNKRVIFYFLIYIISLLLTIKFKSKISWTN
ncbi:hypothetical protein IUY40_00045 [Flavobacterium sp. ALJ2]|uniref:hypothetical protein n=1 Tax=Flavobacterium sp. ALJ2 TaxID=2786960 RepID=UPI00189EF5EB|nr:hypothetical protein [Flavobacterium sp. ALJ2]MBF7089940.1 hypothetical protein [Flavobacterium sp. ALJ2]